MKRRYIPLLAALLLAPALARAEMYSITEVHEQAKALGRWTQTYTDKYGREVAVDVAPIVPEADTVPVLTVEKPKITEGNVYQVYDSSLTTVTQEDFGTVFSYFNPDTDDQAEVRIFSTGDASAFLEYVNLKKRIDNDPELPESLSGPQYHDVDWMCPYFDGYELTVQDCVNAAGENLRAFFSEYDLDLELMWVQIVNNSRPCYILSLRQRMRNIPILMGSVDPVLNLGGNKLGFKPPKSWARSASSFKWGDFTSPSWEYIAYVDGGYQIQCRPLRELDELAQDVPLCGMDEIIAGIEDRIMQGYVRNLHALRLGYCCYLGKEDEIILYPIWQVECDYFYDPQREAKRYEEWADVPITSGYDYRTMIVNAQTGEFMDPIEIKDRLLDCPDIITWEDVL